MRPLCIADTNSLIWLSEVELADKSLPRWLWDEFNVKYSLAVWEEIRRHAEKMGRDARAVRRNGERYVWDLPTVTTCEWALFAPPFYRTIKTGRCRECQRAFLKRQLFTPCLDTHEDRGERHNCCVALDAVLEGSHKQVIFLTDDLRAVRDYVAPVFEIFPLGQIWSSLDFVLYLFMRHRKHIPRATVEAALWDVSTAGLADHSREAGERQRHRLISYFQKAKRIDQVLAQIQGGR